MSQYDVPFLQEGATGKYVQTLLAIPAARRLFASNPSSRVPEVFTSCKGEVYLVGGAATVAFGGINTWTKFALFTANGVAVGCAPDHTTDQITILEAGIYLVGYSLSFSGTSGDEFKFAVRVNAANADNSQSEVVLSGTTSRATSKTCLLSLAVNDVLTLYVNNVAATNALTGKSATLWASQQP